jgi:hypothetical protein
MSDDEIRLTTAVLILWASYGIMEMKHHQGSRFTLYSSFREVSFAAAADSHCLEAVFHWAELVIQTVPVISGCQITPLMLLTIQVMHAMDHSNSGLPVCHSIAQMWLAGASALQ